MAINRFTWFGIAVASAGLFAPQVLATGWCPNSSDNVIYCSNCSRELTCHVYNTSIYIVGDNVTLDGEDYGIWDAPGAGISVYGNNATIRHLDIMSAGSTGILIDQGGSSWSHIDGVMVNGAAGDGVVNEGTGAVSITSNSHIVFNGNRGVVADGVNYGSYTDVNYSFLWGNENASGYYTEKPNSYIMENYIEENSVGLYANADDLQIVGNKIRNNGYGLMLVGGDNNIVIGNDGSLNSIVDCYQTGLTNLTHYDNSWTTWEGSTCVD